MKYSEHARNYGNAYQKPRIWVKVVYCHALFFENLLTIPLIYLSNKS